MALVCTSQNVSAPCTISLHHTHITMARPNLAGFPLFFLSSSLFQYLWPGRREVKMLSSLLSQLPHQLNVFNNFVESNSSTFTSRSLCTSFRLHPVQRSGSTHLYVRRLNDFNSTKTITNKQIIKTPNVLSSNQTMTYRKNSLQNRLYL